MHCSPYNWQTPLAGAAVAEQVHACSEEEQREPVLFKHVYPVPQNWAEGPAGHLHSSLVHSLNSVVTL